MAAKTFSTRFQLKYDTYDNWKDFDNQFILLPGEIAIVEYPNETDPTAQSAVLFKVGNGHKTFNELPFVSAIAGDVPTWAKQQKLSDGETLIPEDAFIKALDDIEVLKAFFTNDNPDQPINILEKLAELEDEIDGNSQSINTINGNITSISGTIDEHSEAIQSIQNDLMPKADIESAFEGYNKEIEEIDNRITYFFETEEVKDTIDTLYEIQNWMNGEGVNATELTQAIAAESAEREKLANQIKDLATKEELSGATTAIINEATGIAQAKADTAKANAVTDSNNYTDAQITNLATVAKTGKISDLIQSGNAEDYIVFNCGTAKTLVKNPAEITYNPPVEEPTE